MYKPGLESQFVYKQTPDGVEYHPHTSGELTSENMEAILSFQKLAKSEARALAAKLISALESVAADIENIDIMMQVEGV